MEILVLGCSSVFLRRVLPALNSCAEITKIHVASKSKSHSALDKKISGKLGNRSQKHKEKKVEALKMILQCQYQRFQNF